MTNKNAQFSVRVPRDLLAKFSYVADRNGRSTNKELEQLMLKHINTYEEKHGEILIDE